MNKKYHNFSYRALMGLEAQLDKQDKLELGNSSKRSNYKNSSFKQPNSSPAHTLGDNSEINTLFNPQENHSLEEFGFDYVNSFSTSFCSPQDICFVDEETLDKIDKGIKEEYICIHYDKCPLHKYSMKCIFGKDKCQTYHFYRYKDFDYGK